MKFDFYKRLLYIYIIFVVQFSALGQISEYCPIAEFDKDWSKDICLDYKGKHGYFEFKDNDEATNYVKQLMALTGLPMNFIISECSGIKNAFAYNFDGVQYIFYGNDFLESLNSEGNNIASITVLAHEIGHHLSGHVISKNYVRKYCRLTTCINQSSDCIRALENKQKQELEADAFAGFIMKKFGAELKDVKQTFIKLNNDEENEDNCSTHPSLSKRLEAVEKGYKRASINHGLSQNNAIRYHIERAKNFAYTKNDINSAFEELDLINEIKRNNQDYFVQKAKFYRKQGNVSQSFETIDKLQELYPNSPTPYLLYAIFYLDTNNDQKIIENSLNTIEVNRSNEANSILAYNLLSRSYANLNEFENASKFYDLLVERLVEVIETMDSDMVLRSSTDFYIENPVQLLLLSTFYLGLKNYENENYRTAMELARKEIDYCDYLDEDSKEYIWHKSNAYNRLGKAYMAVGSDTEACFYFEKACGISDRACNFYNNNCN
ncbi:M48 family metalloprotease [Hyunsoonleella sp. SJ7]|uniref:M48 family metalloprotease n=1 Tax=Hyunsoonleella aquatilis TaxID=2762758 RepID=A0A923H886_9FLAO|nr:M48 family metalloprotease [Hyunsoonleella aquatilis]MBC3758851.1 M48 family metalloprotease [Hyunsoonleella aquatilis]